MEHQMNLPLPSIIQKAIDEGIEFFMGENHEWKMDISGRDEYVERYTECPVLVFADNGYGDFLFLKGGEEKVFEFCHEGPEIFEVEDELEFLLGMKERPPSEGSPPKYPDGQDVQLGDMVEVKSFLRTRNGKVIYVPSLSSKNLELERGGLRMVVVRYEEKIESTITEDPKNKTLLGKVKLLSRE